MFNLEKNTIHIWECEFKSHINEIVFFKSILTKEEKIRANRYYFEKDCNNFVISRGILKYLLSKYLNKKIQELEFEYNKFGKPSLKENQIKFNISHTKNFALFAFTLDSDLGIDIEERRDVNLYQDITKRFFSKNEIELLFKEPESSYEDLFFTIWTRKEAFIKAIGDGLSIPLKDFDVSIYPDKAEIIEVRCKNNNKIWDIKDISTKKYKSAIVFEKKGMSFYFFYTKKINFE